MHLAASKLLQKASAEPPALRIPSERGTEMLLSLPDFNIVDSVGDGSHSSSGAGVQLCGLV